MQPLDTVLLRHRSPTDTHLDWMLDLDAGGELVTFRCPAPWPQWATLGRVPLTELPPHRRVWLARQGRVSGGRGRATRLGRGHAEVSGRCVHGWHLRLRWPAGPGFAAGAVAGGVTRLHQERWEFVADPPNPPGGPVAAMLRPGPRAAR